MKEGGLWFRVSLIAAALLMTQINLYKSESVTGPLAVTPSRIMIALLLILNVIAAGIIIAVIARLCKKMLKEEAEGICENDTRQKKAQIDSIDRNNKRK